MEKSSEGLPQIVITEQPQSNDHRFRYKCERRGFNFGSILGVNSTTNHRTFPAVEILGYEGLAQVHVFCVTASDPPKLHPHKLIGRTDCDEQSGICVVAVNPDMCMRLSFSNLSVQCVKKSEAAEQLLTKPQMYVEMLDGPVEDAQTIDLVSVRLCFVAFLEDESGQFTHRLAPVYSNVIYDKKAKPKLTICELSDDSAPVTGEKKMILLCEKISKDDIQIRFFQDRPNDTRWEAYGTFGPHNVYKQVAITFFTPAYDRQDITENQEVKVQLHRPSDRAVSGPVDFVILPNLEVLPHKPIGPVDPPSSFYDLPVQIFDTGSIDDIPNDNSNDITLLPPFHELLHKRRDDSS